MQGAFDKAPRALLREALLDLPLPELCFSVIGLAPTPYYIEHSGVANKIDANVGVRQGCVAAPLLWVAFKRFWHKHLVKLLGMPWLLNHVVTYADDNHFSWVIRSVLDAHQAMYDARLVLDSFGPYGMSLSREKTVCILKVKGLSAGAFRRRYVVRTRSGTALSFPKISPAQDSLQLPLVQQHVYLGIKVSYGVFMQQTFRYRKQCAQQNFMCLRSWWVPSRLSRRGRINLWLTCVWPSLTYGLEEVGLNPPGCQELICARNKRYQMDCS